MNHNMRGGWIQWKSASGILCDHWIPIKLKGNFYKTIWPAMLYSTKHKAIKKQHVHKMSVARLRISGNTQNDGIRNEKIHFKRGV